MARLTEDVKREISAALPEIKDKHISGEICSVSHVEITSDLSYCKVYVSVLGGKEKAEAAAKVLEKASGFFIRRINARIKMRKMPKLIFLADGSQDYYEKISRLIDNLPKPVSEPESAEEQEQDDE